MRFFSLLDFQYAILLIFLGLIAFIIIYIAFAGYDLLPYKKGRGRKEEIEEYPSGIQARRNPIPLLLILLYIGLAVWGVAYVIIIGIRGRTF
jgi:Na+/H+ antiporter NhaC